MRHAIRKLIVSALIMSLDAYYVAPENDLGALFAYFDPVYQGDITFDSYNLERLRAADLMRINGHR